jgi:toxin ParE1/3/4
MSSKLTPGMNHNIEAESFCPNHVGESLRDSYFCDSSRVSVSERLSYVKKSQPRTGLGEEFLARLEQVFDRISHSPEIHAVTYRHVRQTLLRQFPYVVCYVFDNDRVEVIAVFHGHRDPTSWQLRVS